MIDDRERAIAYVTGRISTLSKARLIQEMDTGRLFVMSGDVTENRVHIYDLQSRDTSREANQRAGGTCSMPGTTRPSTSFRPNRAGSGVWTIPRAGGSRSR